jgi:hypothetical protein
MTTRQHRRPLLVLAASLVLAACAGPTTQPGGSTATPDTGAVQAVDRSNLPYSSPECLAARLPPGDPFPAAAIPPAAQAKRQGGLVAIRYDVVNGAARNLQVVKSSPPGLYDAAALAHAGQYRAAPSVNVRGCVTVIDVKF